MGRRADAPGAGELAAGAPRLGGARAHRRVLPHRGGGARARPAPAQPGRPPAPGGLRHHRGGADAGVHGRQPAARGHRAGVAPVRGQSLHGLGGAARPGGGRRAGARPAGWQVEPEAMAHVRSSRQAASFLVAPAQAAAARGAAPAVRGRGAGQELRPGAGGGPLGDAAGAGGRRADGAPAATHAVGGLRRPLHLRPRQAARGPAGAAATRGAPGAAPAGGSQHRRPSPGGPFRAGLPLRCGGRVCPGPPPCPDGRRALPAAVRPGDGGVQLPHRRAGRGPGRGQHALPRRRRARGRADAARALRCRPAAARAGPIAGARQAGAGPHLVEARRAGLQALQEGRGGRGPEAGADAAGAVGAPHLRGVRAGGPSGSWGCRPDTR